MILLITSNNTLVKDITAALPAYTSLVHVANVTEAQAYLSSQTERDLAPTLILIDTEPDHNAVVGCRQLRREGFTGDVPIVAIIAHPDTRQTVLEAGADDYLLLPLQPAEVNTRLTAHLNYAFRGLSILIKTINQMNSGASPYALNQGIKSLTDILKAPSAWLLSIDPDTKETKLAGSHNLPPLFDQEKTIFDQATKQCLKKLRQDEANIPQIILCDFLAQADPQDTNGLTHLLSIPLNSNKRFIGVLNLAYTAPPKIPRAQKRMLTMLGQDIGVLLETYHLQEETQIYATQNAFMLLMARMVSEQLDPDTILSLTLELTVPLLNASGGDIWLLSDDEQWLELGSSLSTSFFGSGRQPGRRSTGQGLIGWVAAHETSLRAVVPTDDSRFDPQVDQIENVSEYSLLAVPLRHREKTIGVLTIHRTTPSTSFTNQDVVLIEGIVSLTASAIANTRLMQELRDYADQQRVLYEMSQQIASGLDLQVTLDRALHWLNRLSNTEIGLLWLVEKSQGQDSGDTLRLVAVFGVELPQEQQFLINNLGQELANQVIREDKTLMINDPANDPRVAYVVCNKLTLMPRNVLSVPMIYHGQAIGVICLLNKINGPFDQADLTLLTTAIEMVAAAVGNAQLHSQTVALLEERERLHKRILQAERLATVGRLTASLSHEINNPMQAIQGALTLAMEELTAPRELATYINMSLQEADRVIKLVNRMRQIYRPQTETPKELDLNHLLQEIITTARKEMKRQKVTLQTDFSPNLPPITAAANQLHLVFLSLILNLSDAIGTAGGGKLQLRSYALSQIVGIEFSTGVPNITLESWSYMLEPNIAQTETDVSFGLFMSYDIITAYGGTIDFSQKDQQTICRVEFPLLSSNASSVPTRRSA